MPYGLRRARIVEAPDQRAALLQLARLAGNSVLHPQILEAARAITNECRSRDDMCELEAVYEAVKHGTKAVPGLSRGLRYVSDPRMADSFMAPYRLLQMCERGACSGDCDDHAALIVALTSAIGWRAGLRAWGNEGEDFSHVYAIVAYPKQKPTRWVGMDTTVSQASVGWEPPRGHVMDAVLE